MSNEKLIKIAFFASLAGHVGFLGMPAIDLDSSSPEEVREVSVRMEIERPSRLPRIEKIGEEKKIKETMEKQEVEREPEKAVTKQVLVEKEEALRNETKVLPSSEEAMLRYQDLVKQKIEEATRIYPSWAKKRGIEGTIQLSFVVLRNGTAKDIKIIRSSNSRVLDEEAAATIARASPFLPLPQEMKTTSLEMDVSIVFTLE